VVGIGAVSASNAINITATNPYLTVLNLGSGATWDLDPGTGATSRITIVGSATDSSKWSDPSKIVRADDALHPTTAGRTLDITSTGAAGIDLANVENPTTTLNLSGTTIKNTTDIASTLGTPAGASVSADIAAKPTAAQNATALLDQALSGHTTNGTAGKALSNADVAVSTVTSGSGGGPILQRNVPASHVLQVKDRGDGTYGVVGAGIHVTAGEAKQLWALEFKGTQLPAGQNLYGMSAPSVSGDDAAKATVGSVSGTTYGECLTQAKFEFQVDNTGADDDDITVKVSVTFSAAGDGIDVYVPVNVKAP
jgi:hypothetical protein